MYPCGSGSLLLPRTGPATGPVTRRRCVPPTLPSGWVKLRPSQTLRPVSRGRHVGGTRGGGPSRTLFRLSETSETSDSQSLENDGSLGERYVLWDNLERESTPERQSFPRRHDCRGQGVTPSVYTGTGHGPRTDPGTT